MADSVTCDNGCGRTLQLPSTQESGAGWRRLSINRNGKLYFAYVCPHCPETRARANLERKP